MRCSGPLHSGLAPAASRPLIANVRRYTTAMAHATDVHGNVVTVGASVRVLAVKSSIPDRLAPDEAERVLSMTGEILKVAEIDEWGGVWVTKWWDEGGGHSQSHSMSLTAEQMELVHGTSNA